MASASCLQIPVLTPVSARATPHNPSQFDHGVYNNKETQSHWKRKLILYLLNICLLGYLHLTILLVILCWGGREPLSLYCTLLSWSVCSSYSATSILSSFSRKSVTISHRNLTFRHLSYDSIINWIVLCVVKHRHSSFYLIVTFHRSTIMINSSFYPSTFLAKYLIHSRYLNIFAKLIVVHKMAWIWHGTIL